MADEFGVTVHSTTGKAWLSSEAIEARSQRSDWRGKRRHTQRRLRSP